MKVALHGSYYGHNFGDILLMALMTKWIKDYNSQIEVALPYVKDRELNHIKGDENFGLKSLESADLLIYGGGGYFGEPNSKKIRWGFRNIKRHGPAAEYFIKNNKPFGIIGIGAGPITNPIAKKKLVNICKKSSLLIVRDEESKNFLLDNGINQESIESTVDLVLGMNEEDIDKDAKTRSNKLFSKYKDQTKVGVHLANFPKYEKEMKQLTDSILEVAKKTPNTHYFILTDVMGQKNDLMKKLESTLSDNATFIDYESHWDMVANLLNLDVVLTTKLHVGITSVALGKKVLSFPGHVKTPRFYNQLSLNEFCKPLWNLENTSNLTDFIEMNIKNTEPLKMNSLITDKAKLNKVHLENILKENMTTNTIK